MTREIHVLMIEDSEDDALLVLRELRSAGYDVAHVRTDTAHGLTAALESQRWDVVLSDFHMPGFTGTSALRMVREREPDVPFIFVSGTIGEEIAVEAMRSGANDYVMKGHLKRLVPAVERELRDAETRWERRRIEDELRQSERRFAKVFHTTSIGIAIALLDGGRILEVNDAFARIVAAPFELSGRTLAEAGFWSETIDFDQILEQLQSQGAVRDLDLVIHRTDGTACPVLVSFEYIEVGGDLCLLALVHDVSERVRLENQLHQSQKMEAVGRLAGGVAHDFNNILTVIMACSASLDEEVPEEGSSREDVQQIQAAAERAAELTGQLLAFSRRQVVQATRVNLNDVVAGLEPMLRRLIPESIELKTSLGSDVGATRSDRGQLEQVIVNLVVNARDAMLSGGTLAIETTTVEIDSASGVDTSAAVQAGVYVRLTVSDSGVGMDRPTLAHIFEPFYTTKGPGQGTGLGLATVYGTVQQNGGFVSVRSEVGQGSTFEVYLPRVGDRVVEERPDSVPSTLHGTETILLVEDETAVRLLAHDLLTRKGYRVLAAADGAAAIEVAAAHEGRIDLLLSDVVMPRMGGREVAERLMQSYPDLIVLFTSGYTDDVVVRHELVSIGAAFLQKPFTPTLLWKKVRSVLDAHARPSTSIVSHR